MGRRRWRREARGAQQTAGLTMPRPLHWRAMERLAAPRSRARAQQGRTSASEHRRPAKPVRLLCWVGIGALVVLVARTLVYALSPSPLAAMLSHQAGGPRLPIVTLVSFGVALGLSSAVLWLAALGVRERRLLEARPPASAPRLRLVRVVARALVLWPATMVAFALLESYIHWRAGLGWHGLHCLTGPVHRDAIPILAALSLLATAVVAAVEHVLAWMRRVLDELTPRAHLRAVLPTSHPLVPQQAPPRAHVGALGARAPPALS
jgi:hypothetical protein